MAASTGASRESKRLQNILNRDELRTIHRSTIDKIEAYIESKISDSSSLRKPHESKHVSDDRARALENEVGEVTSKCEQYRSKLEATESMLQELEAQLSLCKSELKRTADSLKQSENDVEDMKKQRNFAVDERDNIKISSERKEREIERMKNELATLTTQLEKAINDKCEALSHSNDVQNKEFALNFKEQHMEQERALLKTQIKGLSDELAKSNDELQTIRFTLSQKIFDLENQLQKKEEEIKISKETNEHLNEIKRTIQSHNEELTEKLIARHNMEETILDNYKLEIQSKEKLAELYKSMQEDAEAKSAELANGVAELQKLLTESIDKYGELETKYKQLETNREEIITNKDAIISSMKKELENANELLQGAKDSSIARVLENISPLAGVAGRFLHSSMSVTQLYTHLTTVSDELSKEKEENRQLSEALALVREEIYEKTPLLEELKSRYEEVLENNVSITKQLEIIMLEDNRMRVDYNEATRISTHFQKENEKLKRELADLGRQVCYLLKELQIIRGSPNPANDSNNSGDSLSASNIISKHLVTFSDIQELQTNNQKLLRIIRDLSEKQEETEKRKVQTEVKELQEKCELLETRVSELLGELKGQTQMMENVIKQRDMYRQQCLSGKATVSLDDSMASDDPNASNRSVTNKSTHDSSTDFENLKAQLNETKSQLEKKMEEFSVYKEESVTNQKILVQQIEDMRKEMSQVTSAFSKTAAQLEFLNEKQNTLQLNITTYKKQITSLEERNHNYNIIIGKNEQTIKFLRHEIMSNQGKLSKAEVQVQSLQREVVHLKNIETRLTTERDLLMKEKQGQAVLMTNLELIKASLERAEVESSVKLESKLDKANGEIIALRRSLQEEQERFRELSSHLEKETEHAKSRMEEEKGRAEKLKEELISLREELKSKTNYIDEISKKFSLAINPTKVDGSYDSAKKMKDLENQLNCKESELISLQQQIEDSQQRMKHYCDINEESQCQLNMLKSELDSVKKSSEDRINSLQQSENALKERCSELEAEVSLQTEGSKVSLAGSKTDLAKLIERLKSLQNELKEKNTALEQAKEELLKMSACVQQAENKYAHEMVLHSNDIQLLTQIKEELASLQHNSNDLKASKEQAMCNLEQCQQAWNEQEKAMIAEKQELQSRFEDLNSQNSLLLDQIQALSTKLSFTAVSRQSDNFNDSANVSLSADTSLNRSINEDEVKSSEKLVQIIKFLRKERDIAVAKFDILQAENVRIKSEIQATEKKFDEAKVALSLERQKAEANSAALSKNTEIIRKIETLDAITDSNRVLRVERDNLLQKVNSLTETVSKLEETLIPLQESGKENSLKIEYLQNENNTLKSEVNRWRTRVNALVERANKTSPEDWKRLQNEREILAKMLTTEKDNVKKLNEETTTIKAEKAKCEEQLGNLNKQLAAQLEESKKQSEELTTLRKDLAKISQELGEARSNLAEKSNENEKINEHLKEKEATLNDLRNKEMQIRKIAKKYKGQFEDLSKTVEDDKVKREAEAAESASANESMSEAKKELEQKITDLEKSHAEKIADLEAKINSALEENKTVKAENETLKSTTSEKEEKAKQVLKQAKTKIMQLTESNEMLTKQLSEIKGNIETAEQNKEESDTRFELLTSQYESRVNRAEKEKNEAIQEKQQEIQRLNKEMETLNQRISQLQRQVSGPEAVSATVAPTPTPTANIKPMAAHSASPHPQQTARRGETPFASIRPMASTATRTAAVLPSPSSSGHSSTEYMPASSSARPRPPAADSPPHPPQALVLPRVEEGPGTQPTPPSHSSQAVPPRPSLKRKPQHSDKTTQEIKRSKVQQGQVSESHCETEYQVPTSSQRDHDEDGVVLVDSEDDGDDEQNYQDSYQEQIYDEDDEAEVDDDADAEVVEGGDGMDGDVGADAADEGGEGRSSEAGEGEATASGTDRPESERQPEATSQELPAQSECEVGASSEASVSHPAASLPPPTSSTTATPPLSTHTEAQHTNTVSSGSQGDGGLVVERVSAVQGVYEESGDDGIVPSTPTLFVPRRTDGFGEAVSSPVGAGRFTFTSGSAGAIEDTHADLTSQLSEGGVSGSSEGGITAGTGTSEEGSSSTVVREGEEGREAEASSGTEAIPQRRPNVTQQTQQQSRPVPIVWSPHQGGRGQHMHHRGHPGNSRGRRPNRRPFMRY